VKAAEGVFANPDPYFRPPPRRGRPPKNPDQRASSSNPRTSATPAPIIPPLIPLTQPVPTMPRQASRSRSSSAQSYVSAASPTASEKLRRQSQTESDRAVIAALDARLPRWTGPQSVLARVANTGGIGGSGWWGEGAPDYEAEAGGERRWPQRIRAVVDVISGYRDPSYVQPFVSAPC